MKQNSVADAFSKALDRDCTVPDPAFDEQRLRGRVDLTLPGRYMLHDGAEYPCETMNVSPSGVLLKAAVVAAPGSRVIVYIKDLGRIEGVVVRTVTNGFALAICCTPLKAERLSRRLEWLIAHERGVTKERRRNPRFGPNSVFVTLVTENRRKHVVELIDISTTSVAFLTESVLEVGERVEIGAQRARVARVFQGGAAIAFV